jgi:hypothetical protein
LALAVAGRLKEAQRWPVAIELLERLLQATSGSVVWRERIVEQLRTCAEATGDLQRSQFYRDTPDTEDNP